MSYQVHGRYNVSRIYELGESGEKPRLNEPEMTKFIIALLFSVSVFSQNQLSGKVFLTDSDSDYQYLTVLLKENDSTYIGSQVDSMGMYKFLKKVPNGSYSIVIKQIGSRNMILENIVLDDEDLVIDINYPEKCKYKKDKPLKCVNGHTDKIIPILYGFPSKRLMTKAKKGKIHLGGCVISECDPYFYCKQHNREL